MSNQYARVASRLRVPAGFVIAALYLLFAEPTPLRLLLGGSIAIAGLALRAASAGRLQKNRVLAVSGPYAYTRNPLYLGSAVAGAGFAIAGGRWWFLLLLGGFFLAVYVPVMRAEENRLSGLFGRTYYEYANAVPLLFPRCTPWSPPGGQPERFHFRLYWSNREYRAGIAFLVIVLLLWGKMVWMGSS